MRVVEPGIDVADDDGGAAPVDCPCLGRMDLIHVPLAGRTGCRFRAPGFRGPARPRCRSCPPGRVAAWRTRPFRRRPRPSSSSAACPRRTMTTTTRPRRRSCCSRTRATPLKPRSQKRHRTGPTVTCRRRGSCCLSRRRRPWSRARVRRRVPRGQRVAPRRPACVLCVTALFPPWIGLRTSVAVCAGWAPRSSRERRARAGVFAFERPPYGGRALGPLGRLDRR